MFIPNCRNQYLTNYEGIVTDEKNPYWEGNLNDNDRELLREFDFAADSFKSFFDNLDIYDTNFDIEGEDINLSRFLHNHPAILETLKDAFAHYVEMERNETVVSLIESEDSDKE